MNRNEILSRMNKIKNSEFLSSKMMSELKQLNNKLSELKNKPEPVKFDSTKYNNKTGKEMFEEFFGKFK